jgi:hypothetical protein
MRIKPSKIVAQISLTDQDFECLVRGGILEIYEPSSKKLVKLCLQDIGFDRMEELLNKAEGGKNIRIGYVREASRLEIPSKDKTNETLNTTDDSNDSGM